MQHTIFADCERSLGRHVAALDDLKNSRVLITGATGFVGCWLLAVLAYLNDQHGFGVEITGIARRPSRLREQAPFLAERGDVTLLMADIRQVFEVPGDTRWILHAAANPDSRHHATNPIDTASVIADGTARMLQMAEHADDLRRIVHFSSGLVATRHANERVGASSVYVEAKGYSEALCAAYRTQARLPIVITRPYTFLGPFQALDAPWAANNFLHAALHGQPLKLLGDGQTARSYLYGSDMAVLALLQLIGGKSGETYDLGGITPLPLLELAQTVVAQAGRPLEIRVNTAGRPVGAATLVPDMAKSVQAFGFHPAFTPAEAIARTFAWHSAERRL